MSKVERRTRPAAEYERETPLRVQTDWSDTDTLDSAVACAVSRATGAPMTELAPLYEYMDPDALHEYVVSMRESDSETSVTFEYEGHDVRVRSDGEILIWPSR